MHHYPQTPQQNRDNSIDLPFLASDQKEDDWHSDQFNKPLYMIYKLWLALTFIIALSIQLNLIWYQFQDPSQQKRIALALLSISSILALLNCGQMLLAMMKGKSEFAHKSFVKFQYSIIGTICGLLFGDTLSPDFSQSYLFRMCVTVALPTSIIVSLCGGFVVLGVFKRNNSFARMRNFNNNNQFTRDLLLQNAVIADELLKYEEQLSTCPYFVYRIWLMLVIVSDMIGVVETSFIEIPQHWESQKIGVLGDFYMLMICCWTVFCCYEMEVVLRTKVLEESKKVLFHLKISIFLPIIAPAIDLMFSDKKLFTVQYLLNYLVLVVIPLVTRIGAVNASKIIEQRDQFAKVSGYSGDNDL